MSTINKIEEIIAPLIEQESFELVDAAFGAEPGKKVLCVFIDKEGGITLDDCAVMSEKIGNLLDESNIMPENYILEVSSPGIDRVLKKDKDFIKFTGKKVRVSVYAPIDGQRNFLGKVVSAGEGNVTIEDTSGKTVTLTLDKIARARLEPDI